MSNPGASSKALEPFAIAASELLELTMTGAPVTFIRPLPWALSALLALRSRTIMPWLAPDQLPRATAATDARAIRHTATSRTTVARRRTSEDRACLSNMGFSFPGGGAGSGWWGQYAIGATAVLDRVMVPR